MKIEDILYEPKGLQWLLPLSLLPLSLLYCIIASIRKIGSPSDPGVPVISIGNIVVGGSGKTPLLITLAQHFSDVAVVLRGYRRKSRGLVIVSDRGEILCDVKAAGDEAILIAKSLKATVIVSEDRLKGIKEAQKRGAKVVFLDDGFRHKIEKFDIVIDKPTKNPFCLPAGPKRMSRFFLRYADLVLQEERDFWRKVKIINPTKKMVLVTAIANPKRLLPYLPSGIPIFTFKDHYYFTKEEIEAIFKKTKATSLLVTRKDAVKLENFGYPLSILDLDIKIDEEIIKRVKGYIKEYDAKKVTNGTNAS